jgi:hypothetical protein
MAVFSGSFEWQFLMHNTMINHGKLGLPNLETLDMLSRLSSLH